MTWRAVAADLYAVGELDLRAFGAKGAAGQLVGRADAVDVQHAGQQFEFAELDVGGGADAGQDGLVGAGGSMNVDSGFHHGVDDCIDLLFGGLLLHGYNHCFFPVSGACAPAAWPGRCWPGRFFPMPTRPSAGPASRR